MLSFLGCGITRHGARVQEKNLQYILNNFIITVFIKFFIKARTMIILGIFMIYLLSEPCEKRMISDIYRKLLINSKIILFSKG